MVGSIGSFTQGDVFELRYRGCLNDYRGKPVEFLQDVVQAHEQFDAELEQMGRFKRGLVTFVHYLAEGACMPGKTSPHYKAATEILERPSLDGKLEE